MPKLLGNYYNVSVVIYVYDHSLGGSTVPSVIPWTRWVGIVHCPGGWLTWLSGILADGSGFDHGAKWENNRCCFTAKTVIKFVHLIMEIIPIVATKPREILGLKCTKFNFGWLSAPDPTGELLQRSPRPFSWWGGAKERRLAAPSPKNPILGPLDFIPSMHDPSFRQFSVATTFTVAVASLAVRCKNLTIASGNHGSSSAPSWSCTTSAFCQ